jgi:cytidylate kinase
MSSQESLDALNVYMKCQLVRSQKGRPKAVPPSPFVTVTRQTGAGAITVAEKVAVILNGGPVAEQPVPWTVFDRNLIDVVLEQHDLPSNVAKYMPEDRVGLIEGQLGEILGLHPSVSSLVKKTSQTIMQLAEMGHAILVGRGANILTRGIDGGFHVRLIAAADRRIEHLKQYYGLDQEQATERMRKTDEARMQYVRQNFDQDDSDSLLYDCVINTTHLTYDEAAQLIAGHVRRRTGQK